MKKDSNNGSRGVLPSQAPLANPYVPFQQTEAPMYNPRTAFVRGTLFAGLDLPFMGIANKNERKVTPMNQLQTISFAIAELALYLDTHRDDTEAMEVYRSFQKMMEAAKIEYQKECGPLTHLYPDHGDYRWLNEPWPWEYAKNREV